VLLFFDKLSEILYDELPETTSAYSKVMINIDQFNIGQIYVTAKVENRYGDIININIEGGLCKRISEQRMIIIYILYSVRQLVVPE
jgi:hypothetical protein